MNEESLFVAALEKRTPSERRAFLAEACAGDIPLQKRLEQLLAAHLKTLGILDQPDSSTEWSEVFSGAAQDGARPDETGGTLIADRYRLIEVIGVGGMGTVWKAEQTQPVRRTVALKLIRAGMDSKTVLLRFEAERQALALMDHPNIAKVLDGGTTESGSPFFVMEYVEGVPFTEYCDDGRLSIAERLDLFVSVCQAVQHAHSKGVIHRDLKPSNILVCMNDGRPVPKVIDFGLAKAIQQPLTESTLQTAHGVLLGTPLYMSPEQAESDNLDVDTRTDIYALGVILYELLTGTTPLERKRLRDVAWIQIIYLIKQEDPPRPSARLNSSESLPSLAARRQLEPARLTRLVRGELDWIAMKCLEKDRSRRYETADGLARDVQRYLTDESVEACPPSVAYRLSKFVRRNGGTVLAISMIFVLLVGGIVGTTWGLVRADRALTAEATRAEGERKANEKAQMRLKQLEGGIDFLETVFRDLDPRAEDKEGKPLREILGERIVLRAEQIEGEAVGDSLVVADLQYRLGLSLLHLGMPERAIPLFVKVSATRSARLGPEQRDTLRAMNALAEGYHAAGDLNKALPLLEETYRLRKVRLGADDNDTLFSMNNLAVAYKADRKLDQALPLLVEVFRLRKAKLGDDDRETLQSMNNLALAYMAANRPDEARPLLEEALKRRKARLHADHPDTLSSMNSLAHYYQSRNELGKALPLLKETLALRQSRLGLDHPDTLISMNNLAAGYKSEGKLEMALSLLEDAVKRSKARRGLDNPYTLATMSNLAWIYRTLGKLDLALAINLEAAQAVERRRFRDEFADGIVLSLIETLEELKRFDASEAWWRKSRTAAAEHSGADSLRYAGVTGGLGANLIRQKRWAEAESLLRDALAILGKKSPASLPMFNDQSLLGTALLGQKKFAEAEPLLIRGYEGLKAREAQVRSMDPNRLAEAGEQIIQLYESWGKPEKAAEWRTKLAETRGAAAKP